LYSVEADLRDAMAVLDHVGPAPVPMVGHSSGGAISLHLADAAAPNPIASSISTASLPPHRCRTSRSTNAPACSPRRSADGWDHRRSVSNKARRPGTVAELARAAAG
jgi:pimeloyl-ACP methyl ester carboxylesterase